MGQGEISVVRGCEDELGQEAGVGGVAVEETGAEGEAFQIKKETILASASCCCFFFDDVAFLVKRHENEI